MASCSSAENFNSRVPRKRGACGDLCGCRYPEALLIAAILWAACLNEHHPLAIRTIEEEYAGGETAIDISGAAICVSQRARPACVSVKKNQELVSRGIAVREICTGWGQIADYIGTSVSTAQRCERPLALPVRRRGKGTRPPVYAIKSELDAWLRGPGSKRIKGSQDSPARHPTLASSGPALQAHVIDRIHSLTNLTLYRRNYHMDFSLKPTGEGVRVNVAIGFELLNASDESQPYTQEITIDDADHGYVEEMTLLKDGIVIYALKNPAPFAKRAGHSVYHGRKVMIEPERSRLQYACRARWVINRQESDLWYNHMLLPTVGLSLVTHGPPEYEITPPFSTPDLALPAEHMDIAWSRKK